MAAAVSVYFISGKRTARANAPLGQWLNPPTVLNVPVIYSPTIIADQLLLMPLVSAVPVVYAPTVSRGQGLLVPLLTQTPTIYAPRVNQSIQPPLITSTPVLYGPIVTRNDGLSLAIPLLTNTPSIFAPRVNQSLKMPLLTQTPGIFAPTVSLASAPNALSTPAVTRTSANGAVPEIDITMGSDIYAGFYLRVQRSTTGSKNVSDGSYVSPTLNIIHMVMPQEVARGEGGDVAITNADMLDDGYIDPPSGAAYYQQYRWEREDGAISNWSNEISDTVSAATTALYTVTGVNKKSYIGVSGTPALVASGTATVGAPQSVRSTSPKTGKRQFQVTITTLNSLVYAGVDNAATDLNSGFQAPGITNANGVAIRVSASGYDIWKAGSAVQSGATGVATGDIITAVFDTTAATMSFYRTRSGTTVQFGTTVTGIGLATWQAFLGTYDAATLTANFGQSAFARALDTGYAAYG